MQIPGKILVLRLPSYVHTASECRQTIFFSSSTSVVMVLKNSLADGFVKKSADTDSVSDSPRRHYKLIYTGRRRAQRLSTGGRQMRRRCTSQAIVLRRHRRNATTGQRAVRSWTVTRKARTPRPAGRDSTLPRSSTLHCPICTQTTQQHPPSVDT